MREKLISADEALHKLLDGNERFVQGQPASPQRSPEDFRELAEAPIPRPLLLLARIPEWRRKSCLM
jgi:hypothetical protein